MRLEKRQVYFRNTAGVELTEPRCPLIIVSARSLRSCGLSLALLSFICPPLWSQKKGSGDLAVVEGAVCDSQNRSLEDATVFLESADRMRKFVRNSDSQGRYRISAVPYGSYIVRAGKPGYGEKSTEPFNVGQTEVQIPVLHLANVDAPPSPVGALPAVEFSDETTFIVAGVTDPSNLGGHGSDTDLRTREALAKDAASLSHERAGPTGATARDAEGVAEAHARLGDVAESEGRPLEAEREYERATQLNPSEAHLFAWGAELLLHRAFAPAIEVFARGQQRFPSSSRMIVGLGVATYDQGATDRGEQLLLQACDLNPSDFTPYLFMGRLLEAEKAEPQGWTEKLRQFVSVHPENALAHYYFAAALSKRSPESEDFAAVESELREALELDPQLGKAYLQLGILYTSKKNIPDAIRAFQKAVETMPLPDEAHFRLAQLYRQTGEVEKAHTEMDLYGELSQRRTRDAERSRHEIQQFVYTLRGLDAAPATPEVKPQ
jgi:tetratricopeptide (TPR) repeat protein